ncbi:MAG TPA: proton-conducting transporter membrane subunit, partial [Rhodocyclaceae bacterium]|nr:proton-conducting transporter membrane subunit [Rhodocyclaceae bacterium]
VFTPAGDGSATPWRLAGHALLIAGIGFKLSLVPFHLWTPDVYQGAPAPVTGFLAALSKGAAFAALLRYAGAAGLHDEAAMTLALALLAAASMLAGNLLALLQDDLKRLLAYSSIAHLGYLMVALLAAGPFGAEAAGYYLAAYMVTTLAAFAVITVHSAGVDEHESAHELTRLADYAGLFWRRPWLAAVFTTALLSLAGIPLTMGFVAKFYLFAAGAAEGLWALLAVLVVASVLGLFYYLRVVATLFAPVPKDVPAARAAGGLAGAAVLAALAAAMLGLGVLPQALIEFARAAALTLH